jgi:hypothetical protein
VPSFVDQGREDHMYVIRHHDGHVQFIPLAVIVAAGSQHDISRCWWQDPPELSNKSDEVWSEVPLQMRQVPPIKLHKEFWHARSG